MNGLARQAGIYHYAPKEHALEQRCELNDALWRTLGGHLRHATDAAGRAHRSTIEAWVTGAADQENRRAKSDELQLIPDRRTYEPGDIAEVLVIAPFTPAHGIVALERDGIVRTEPLHVTEGEPKQGEQFTEPKIGGLYPMAGVIVGVIAVAVVAALIAL